MGRHESVLLSRIGKAIRRGLGDLAGIFLPRRARARRRALRHFRTPWYLEHNRKRQEHLASLGLDLGGRSVLEVGAGVGDHTDFWLERGCRVLVTEPREDNLAALRARFPGLEIRRLDLDRPDGFDPARRFEIVYCYGTLYHLGRPAEALRFLSGLCEGMLLLETCVRPGAGEVVDRHEEPAAWPSQSVSGAGSRPTRGWIRARLAEQFAHVYLPVTQPDHPEFPLDWTSLRPEDVARAVFVASRAPLDNPLLVEAIPDRQEVPGGGVRGAR